MAHEFASKRRPTEVYGDRRKRRYERIALATFLVLIGSLLLFGGSSRSDQAGLLLLRPIALVAAAYATLVMTRENWAAIRIPVLLLAALAVLIAIQLVPLPPLVWSMLPGGDAYLATYQAIDMDPPWLPISKSPVLTWNALVSLIVPASVLMCYSVLNPRHAKYLVSLLLLIGLASALLGVLQLLSDGARALHLYSISNFGSNTGFFANRNHHAVFLATILLLVPVARRQLARDRIPAYAMNLLAMAIIVFLSVSIGTTGSRVGLVLGALAAIWSSWRIYQITDETQSGGPRRHRGSFRISVKVQKLFIPLALVSILIAVALGPRSLGVDRLFAEDAESTIEDMRFEIYANTLEMIPDSLPFGGGAGTFPEVYRSYEDTAGISHRYVNHVHNDWLEYVYELGLPGVLLMLVAIAILANRAAAALRLARGGSHTAKTAALALVFLAAGSLLDYPLRTPLLASIAMLFIALLTEPRTGSNFGQPRTAAD